jgi:DNA-binding HxlR family transcriptional regulator
MEKTRKARWTFLTAMLNKDWVQTKDLKVYTHISPRTLYKILKDLKPFIERKEDKTTYPASVYYRLNGLIKEYLVTKLGMEKIVWKEIEEQFLKTKDVNLAINQVNAVVDCFLAMIIDGIKGDKWDMSREEAHVFLDMFVWESYETLTRRLIDSCFETLKET